MDVAKVRMSGAEGFYQNASNKYANTLPDNATAAAAMLLSAAALPGIFNFIL